MACPRFVTIDTFPSCEIQKRVLMYYMVKSTRITIVCFGSRYVLLYNRKKLLKRHILPEDVTCSTIINMPRLCADAKGDEKILLCGTDCGSVFAIKLPSSKQSIAELKAKDAESATLKKDRTCQSDHVLVYKYTDLELSSISCIDGHIVLLGKDETSQNTLFMFQPEVLSSALSLFKGEQKSDVMEVSSPYEKMTINAPSVSSHSCTKPPNFVIFQDEQKRSSPYHNSLDNVLYVDQSLFRGLFGSETCRHSAPVVCLFYPSGEIWHISLKQIGLSKPNLEYLCNIQEECMGLVPVLLDSSFDDEHCSESDGTRSSDFRSAIVVFGQEHHACVLSSKPQEESTDETFKQTYIPYTTDLKMNVEDWNGLVSIPEAFLLREYKNIKGMNVTSSHVAFAAEQRVVLKGTDEIWTFQDYESHASLLSVNTEAFWTDADDMRGNPAYRVQDILSELEDAEQKCTALKEQSSKLSDILRAVGGLYTYLCENSFSNVSGDMSEKKRPNELLCFDISHMTVDCAVKKQVNIMIKVKNNDAKFVLLPFNFQVDAVIKCTGAASSHTYMFDIKDLEYGNEKNLCIMVDCDELDPDCQNEIKLSIFVNISGLQETAPDIVDVARILKSGFPILFKVYYIEFYAQM